jgi:carboxyl-terminal processing protease
MMRKVSLIMAGAALGAAIATVTFHTNFISGGPARAAASDTYRDLNLFGDVFEKIRTDYVEKPDEEKLVEAAINGMLASLDPHSSYMDAKAYRDMQVQTRGEFGGLGIEVTQEDGNIKVVTPIDDTPASKAGVLAGDLIIAIDGENVSGLTLNQAVDKMRGAVGTTVTLKIQRPNVKDPQDVKITRAVIQIKSVKFEEKDDVGYIRITQFNEQTYDGLKQAMQKFQADIPADKFKGYILDLRNNPGGLLDQSIEVSNAFIDRGEIVSTRGRNADETQRYNARPGNDLSHGKPLVVLINGGSASASEIVAGALQDHKRATILGTRSFGKGSVQTIIPLGQNGALRLTTARYYTPSGRSIQAKGIEPEMVVLEDVPDDLKGKDDTKGEASLKGHLKNGDDEKQGSQAYVPPDPKNDKQLIAALSLLSGNTKASNTVDAPKTPQPN